MLAYADVCWRVLQEGEEEQKPVEEKKSKKRKQERLSIKVLCFTCFTGTKVQILTQKTRLEALNQGTPFFLLYWYKSTNTDADDAPRSQCYSSPNPTLHYWYKRTSFIGTKVQILTQKTRLDAHATAPQKPTSFTGPRVLDLMAQKYKYWRKSRI